jgi:hypothetical protein
MDELQEEQASVHLQPFNSINRGSTVGTVVPTFSPHKKLKSSGRCPLFAAITKHGPLLSLAGGERLFLNASIDTPPLAGAGCSRLASTL